MGEDTSNPLEVADTERVEEGDRGMDDGWEEAMGLEPALVQGQEWVQGDGDDELAGVVTEGNVQGVGVGSDRIH